MLRVVHLGLGHIGKGTLRGLLAQSPAVKIVGVVDISPEFIGKSLREVLGRPDAPAMKVSGSLAETIEKTKPDVATVTTVSRTADLRPALEALIAAKVHVVSVCEELSYPRLKAAKIAAELDRRAKKKGVVILGTGVNPGFTMDAFALTCTAPCTRVRSIRVTRTLDAARRRYQLQKKVGAGMSVEAVQASIRTDSIGHVGLGESAAMLAEGLGWKLQGIQTKSEPVVADQDVSSEFFQVKAGQVRGMRTTVIGIVKKEPRIELSLTMALGSETYDEVAIDGDPSLVTRTTTGFPGEASTVGMLINCARIVGTLEPGMRTMLDVLKVRSMGT